VRRRRPTVREPVRGRPTPPRSAHSLNGTSERICTVTSTVSSTESLRAKARAGLEAVGATIPAGDDFAARTPITGEDLFRLKATTAEDVEQAVAAAAEAFSTWRNTPAPVR